MLRALGWGADALALAASTLIDRAAASPWRSALLVLLVSLVLFAPGLSTLPVTDRDEGRFVQASRQMLESGDVVDIRFQDRPRWKKPAGIYWMQAGAAAAFGGAEEAGIGAYRLPSLIGAILAALGALWALRPLLGPRAALIAALMTASTAVLVAEAHIAKTDAMLCGLTVIVMGAWIRLQRGGAADEWLRALLWGAMALGVLVKGPMILLPLAGAAVWMAIFERSWRPLTVMGWASPAPLLFLAIALPWYALIQIRTGGAFFDEALGRDLLGKIAEGKEAHGAPPGTYLAVLWGVFWPWAPLALIAAPFVWAARRRAEAAVLLGWLIPFWLILEATPTKLPHYILPVLPAFAGLLALWAEEGAGAARRWQAVAAAAIFALVGGALALANLLGLPLVEGAFSPVAAVLAIVGGGAVAIGARAILVDDRSAVLGAAMLAALTLFPATLGATLPGLTTAFPSRAMAAASAPFAACAGRPAASLSFREPSLVFLQGTGTRLIEPADAAAAFASPSAAEPGFMVWVEDRRRALFDEALGAEPQALDEIATVRGFNVNRGGMTTIRLMARAGDPVLAPCLGR